MHCIYVLACLLLILFSFEPFQISLGEYPSFVRQEVPDSPMDWVLLRYPENIRFVTSDNKTIYINHAVSRTDCKLGGPNFGHYPSPDIKSVSFLSDGKNLNATMWLTGPFRDPSTNNALGLRPFSMAETTDMNEVATPHQEIFEVYEASIGNATLNQVVSDEIKDLKANFPEMVLVSSKPMANLSGLYPAHEIIYTVTDGQRNSTALEILSTANNFAFLIKFFSDSRQYNHFLPLVRDTINSFNFSRPIGYDSKTYENANHRISVNYPLDWSRSEVSTAPKGPRYDDIAAFSREKNHFFPSVAIFSDNLPIRGSNGRFTLDDYLNQTVKIYEKDLNNFLLDYNSTNHQLGGKPAYGISYLVERSNGVKIRAIEISAIVGDDRVYTIRYADLEDEFNVKTAKKIIDSLQFNLPTLTYYNPIFPVKMEYLSDWINIGTHESNFNYSSSARWTRLLGLLTPIEGPFYLNKEFRVSIDVGSVYDSPTDYVSRIKWVNGNQNWNKTVEEVSLDGRGRVINETVGYDNFSKEGQNYVLLPLDSGTVNFPNQVLAIFSAEENFIKDGRLCVLADNSNQVSLPPPRFEVEASPNPLIMRAGEEKRVELKIQSFVDIDANATISPNVLGKDIEVKAQPNNITIPALGLASIVLIVDSNETASQGPHTLSTFTDISFEPMTSIRSRGLETPIYNPSSIIPKSSNFTITVNAPLPLYEQISNFFNPQLSGWGALITAAVPAVITFLLGRKLEQRKHIPH